MLNENENNLTTRERGDSLELAIEHIFGIAGFETSRNKFIANYEVDVLAKIGNRRVAIECKNYQNSSLTIRNLIHQWSSKNQIIKAHKIIIAIAGQKIKEQDYALASQFDIEIWSQDDISDLFNLSLSPDKLKKELIDKIDFKPLSIAERFRDDITYLVIKPLLSHLTIAEEQLYWHFNNMLRSHILTELHMTETTSQDRANYIQLFEGNKTKKGFLNLVTTNRKEKEYWDEVNEQLKSQEILSPEKQNQYISNMDDLINEYNNLQNFFKSDDILTRTKKLIESRLQNAFIVEEWCNFYIPKTENDVLVHPHRDNTYKVTITNLSRSECNTLNWIMTSQFDELTPEEKDKNKSRCTWYCSTFKEAAEKVFRVFSEYYDIERISELRDSEIK